MQGVQYDFTYLSDPFNRFHVRVLVENVEQMDQVHTNAQPVWVAVSVSTLRLIWEGTNRGVRLRK